jgi:acyl-CoA synthetase (NDP forming)
VKEMEKAAQVERLSSKLPLDVIFSPRSVAVVGVSPKEMNVNRFFLESLVEMGFPGRLFALNLRGEKVDDFPTYKRLTEIPDRVDHVIVAVPASSVWDVLQDAARKEVQSVTVFTSGFSESGDPEGALLEERIRGWIRAQPFRLIGPNCMGVYCPSRGLSFRPDFPKEPGPIGYVSQSGGMTISGILFGASRGLRFSKAVSYGNEADVSSVELLKHLSRDESTGLVWLYVEGTRSGKDLREAMEEVARRKPLLVLKGGKTSTGVRAARSHTGSMAGSSDVWRGLLRQVGAIEVDDLEDLVGTTQCILWSRRPRGRRIALVCVSGGLSVNYTDKAVKAGFEVPRLSGSLIKKLRGVLDLPGTSMENPLDLAAGFFRYPLFPEIFKLLDSSGEIDLVLLILALEYFHIPEHRLPGITMATVRTCVGALKGLVTPSIVVMPHGLGGPGRTEIERMFLEAEIPVFQTVERALRAMSLWCGSRIL